MNAKARQINVSRQVRLTLSLFEAVVCTRVAGGSDGAVTGKEPQVEAVEKKSATGNSETISALTSTEIRGETKATERTPQDDAVEKKSATEATETKSPAELAEKKPQAEAAEKKAPAEVAEKKNRLKLQKLNQSPRPRKNRRLLKGPRRNLGP